MVKLDHGHPLYATALTVTSGQWRATGYIGLGGDCIEMLIPEFGWVLATGHVVCDPPKHAMRHLVKKWHRKLKSMLRECWLETF